MWERVGDDEEIAWERVDDVVSTDRPLNENHEADVGFRDENVDGGGAGGGWRSEQIRHDDAGPRDTGTPEADNSWLGGARTEETEQTCHRVASSTDVDGWALEQAQLDIVEELDKDLAELHALLSRCCRPDNQERIRRAICESEVKRRVKLTWIWFPLPEFTWSGYEYGSPTIVLTFTVPGVGSLPPEDIHCSFGVDWFDLKIWNVAWPEDPGSVYHHRVLKTRLLRDIVPSACSVKARNNRLRVQLKKAYEPRHGYCAWVELTAGTGRKPFRYNEDAADGGLMEFLEAEYERKEGYDGFRRDIGKAMEQLHRGEPVLALADPASGG